MPWQVFSECLQTQYHLILRSRAEWQLIPQETVRMTGCYGYILELASHAQCVSIVSCIYYVCVPQMCTYTFF